MAEAVLERTGAVPSVAMDVLEAIRTRRSVGTVRPEAPSRETIEAILDAATWAPNHRLTEPWRFFVLTGDARESLGDVMARSKLAGKEGTPEELQAEYERARAKPLRAPVIIAVAVEPATGPKIVEIEEVAAGAAAVQNMLLAAHALGLAAIWRTGDACYDAAVKSYFDLSPASHLLGFVYLGYPAAVSVRSRHTPAAEVTRWLGWNE
ncbi:MAG: nitroreductase family protein [Thermomicrobiales bacterium]